ncbi:phosphomannomutase [Rhodoferax sp. 4810]|uniref:Phosphomannomutase n=1 Tax=Thiospirillum jenense TaxID=1653858 RepID=A0A839HH41_9GAMM|nr:phosphomannomutase [Thiospirillum jenense]MBB1074562.1 phosphomannomutase [Rhodoferax jenense]MBB1126536.1 phosphomannomutase [Thiospirillum jenense]
MRIDDLMTTSGVQFGTSGARGLVTAMTDQVCYSYTIGFLNYLREIDHYHDGMRVALAGDYRASTPRILTACAQAVRDCGGQPCYLGTLPTPALAAYGLTHRIPSLMVTGSHIPDDRNGIKFYRADGEILKDDERGIRAQDIAVATDQFDAAGRWRIPTLPPADPSGLEAYVQRFIDFFPADCLAGLRIGLYEHSSVARTALALVLTELGATVTRLGQSSIFVPVDTEAVRPADIELAREWCAGGQFDAIISTDGDGDRPLISDARGNWLRGDIAGVLCARALGATAVVTPISSNSVVERCGWFDTVERCRIGSPYVIAAMQALTARGASSVVGYEANGGFLQATAIHRDGRTLAALPTRDAVIVAIAILSTSRASGQTVAELAATLPPRFTASDRLQNCPAAVSAARLAVFNSGDVQQDCARVQAALGDQFAQVAAINHTDGLRVTFNNDDIVHFRPSGNAPELRVYAESNTAARAQLIIEQGIDWLRHWLN